MLRWICVPALCALSLVGFVTGQGLYASFAFLVLFSAFAWADSAIEYTDIYADAGILVRHWSTLSVEWKRRYRLNDGVWADLVSEEHLVEGYRITNSSVVLRGKRGLTLFSSDDPAAAQYVLTGVRTFLFSRGRSPHQNA